MKRRDVLKVGAAAGAASAVAGGSACATGAGLFQRHAGDGDMPDMDELLPRFDRVMAATESPEFVAQFAPIELAAATPEQRARTESNEDLVRRCIRAMFVTATFLDLPEQAQLHPGMQQRILDYAPELDAAVYDVIDMLRDLPEADRRAVRRTLKDRPDLPMELAASINGLAKTTGISRTRRMQVRSLMAQTGWRLRKQNPSIIIDEYVDKIEKVAPRDATEAEMRRRIAAIVGPAAIQRAQAAAQFIPGGPGAPGPGLPTTTGSDVTPGQRTTRRGAKAMGLGILTFGGGAAIGLALGSFVGIFAVTAGAVMFTIGLIIAFVGILEQIGE